MRVAGAPRTFQSLPLDSVTGSALVGDTALCDMSACVFFPLNHERLKGVSAHDAQPCLRPIPSRPSGLACFWHFRVVAGDSCAKFLKVSTPTSRELWELWASADISPLNPLLKLSMSFCSHTPCVLLYVPGFFGDSACRVDHVQPNPSVEVRSHRSQVWRAFSPLVRNWVAKPPTRHVLLLKHSSQASQFLLSG